MYDNVQVIKTSLHFAMFQKTFTRVYLMNIAKKLVFFSLACTFFVEKSNAAEKIWCIFGGAAASTAVFGGLLIKEKFINWMKLGEIEKELGEFRGETSQNFEAMTDLVNMNHKADELAHKKTQGRVDALNFNLWKFNKKTTLTLAGLKTDTNTLNKKTNILNGLLGDIDTKMNTLTEETLPNLVQEMASAKEGILNQIATIRDEHVTKDYLKQEFATFKEELKQEVADTVRTTMREEFGKQNKGFEKVIHTALHAAVTAGFLNPTRSLLPSNSGNSNDSNNPEETSQLTLSPSSSASNLSTSESE